MDVFPAIDLRGGRCVRLFQGDYTKERVFSDDPVGVAQRWQREGAQHLHVVDLDGAGSGNPANLQTIQRIASETSLHVQVGGGIRTIQTAEKVLSLGVERVIIGTVAVEDPDLVARMLKAIGTDHLVVGVDARAGKVAVKGWKEQLSVDALGLMNSMATLGVQRFIYTDIARDGTLTEPNFEALAEAVARVRADIVASGGVSRKEHVARLAAIGVAGCIIGTALYTGDVKLPDALAAARSPKNPSL